METNCRIFMPLEAAQEMHLALRERQNRLNAEFCAPETSPIVREIAARQLDRLETALARVEAVLREYV